MEKAARKAAAREGLMWVAVVGCFLLTTADWMPEKGQVAAAIVGLGTMLAWLYGGRSKR